jgi:L-lactate permease
LCRRAGGGVGGQNFADRAIPHGTATLRSSLTFAFISAVLSCIVLLLSCRLLGTIEFQSTLGIIITTIRKSASELLHLLILVAIVMFMMAMGNHLILGTYIQEVGLLLRISAL